jgi:hypothetical protein
MKLTYKMGIWLVFTTEKIYMLTVEEQAILKYKKRKFEECKKAWEYSVPNPNLITLQFFGEKNRNPFLRLIPIICDPRQ